MTTAAEVLVAQLESYGVRYVFGTCGHTNIALLDAMGRSSIDLYAHEIGAPALVQQCAEQMQGGGVARLDRQHIAIRTLGLDAMAGLMRAKRRR